MPSKYLKPGGLQLLCAGAPSAGGTGHRAGYTDGTGANGTRRLAEQQPSTVPKVWGR